MGYFSNGTEQIMYEEDYCDKCVHRVDCPIMTLHLLWNYDAVGENADKTKAFALNELIPIKEGGIGNEKCNMFHKGKPPNEPLTNRQQMLEKEYYENIRGKNV